MSDKNENQSCPNEETSCKEEVFQGLLSLFALADEEEAKLKKQSNESE